LQNQSACRDALRALKALESPRKCACAARRFGAGRQIRSRREIPV